MIGVERHQRRRLATKGHELDLVGSAIVVNEDSRSHVSSHQAVFRQIDCQHHSIELTYHRDPPLPGKVRAASAAPPEGTSPTDEVATPCQGGAWWLQPVGGSLRWLHAMRVLLFLVALTGVALVVGCAPQQPAFNPPYEEVDLSVVDAQVGFLTADDVAGRSYAGINVTVLENGTPGADITVYLLPLAPANSIDAYPHASTDNEGHVSFDKVPTGASLKVWAELTVPRSATVLLSAGTLTEATLGE